MSALGRSARRGGNPATFTVRLKGANENEAASNLGSLAFGREHITKQANLMMLRRRPSYAARGEQPGEQR
jgi:hypothetical protein